MITVQERPAAEGRARGEATDARERRGPDGSHARGEPVADVGARGEPADNARERDFAALMNRRALDAAYRYATLVLGDRAEAEDATHDAALSAWRHYDQLRDPERFDAWFGRILVNACRDRLRARRRMARPVADPGPADGGGGFAWNPAGKAAAEFASTRGGGSPAPSSGDLAVSADDPAERIARRDALSAALRSLSPEHVEVVVLRFWADLTVDQIAARIGVGPGTVKSRLHYALRNLRAAVGADEDGRHRR